jgi:hypothetical protein
MRMAATVGLVPQAAKDVLDVLGHLLQYKNVKLSDVEEMRTSWSRCPHSFFNGSSRARIRRRRRRRAAASGARGQSRAAVSTWSPACHDCGQRGHVRRECTQAGPTCYRCGKTGHIATDCPNDSR